MSKIREFVSKGVRLIVTDTDAGERAETAQEKEIPPDPSQRGLPERRSRAEPRVERRALA